LSLPVTNIVQTLDKQADTAANTEPIARWLPWILFAGAIVVLFYQLGAAALFDPDEGRNSEKAREILALNDWITPHENFYAVLDKPIFFYWLIALSYKLFGISEWAARLPSALAALGCLVLVYFFTRVRRGRWTALWSTLILLTNIEFFSLARIVIFDMSLTFFLTLALCAFYEAAHTEDARRRRIICLVMYVAFGAGTLLKGLIGVVVPGMVIFFYLLLGKQWAILKRIYLVPGALIFLAMVLPWYLQAEARNAGYLRYYLWDEHFGRFASGMFRRGGPWYYFFPVVLVGFFPWSFLLPFVVREYWKNKLDDKTLFLILWVSLPFIFFSISKSKLPHYILPIFPALAMLTATALVSLYRDTESKIRLALSLAWLTQSLAILYLIVGSVFPAILSDPIREGVSRMPHFLWACGATLVLVFLYFALSNNQRRPKTHGELFLTHAGGLALFFAFSVEMMVLIAPDRSAKPLAEKAMPLISPATQVVFYETHLAGMPFYLRSERPIWLVTHENKKRTFLGNYYASAKIINPISRWGNAIFEYEEFRDKWQTTKQPLLIIVKEKNLGRLTANVGESPKTLAAVDEYLLVTKQ
jgi:4-amino-4-deoxy-L-arabinose transferase-like glycosyltransferase